MWPCVAVLHFVFNDVARPADRWWLVVGDDDVDVCDDDPGHPVTVTMTGARVTMTCLWLGDVTWDDAIRDGGIVVQGPAHVRRALPAWLKLSVFAAVPRPAHSPRGQVA